MIAVTGANGLLGSFIVRDLLSKNQPVLALRRKGSDTSLLSDVSSQLTWRDADVLDPIQLAEALEGASAVVHTAAVVSFNPRRSRFVLDTNVQGTRNVVIESHAKGIKRFVHISSVAALGRQKGQRIIDETNQWIDSPMNTVYAQSKYLAELEVFRAYEEGMNAVILNPSVILGPGDWNKSSAQLFKYVWKERRFYTSAFLNYVDVRDVSRTACSLLDRTDISGERFILNAGKISFHDFFQKVATNMKKSPPSVNLSPRLLNLLARAEALRSRATGEEPLITRETARLAGTEFYYDSAKIREALSLEFQPLDDSIRWCCDHYLRKYGK